MLEKAILTPSCQGRCKREQPGGQIALMLRLGQITPEGATRLRSIELAYEG